jgi:hypothetical protein
MGQVAGTGKPVVITTVPVPSSNRGPTETEFAIFIDKIMMNSINKYFIITLDM